jgi:hypothetical protein
MANRTISNPERGCGHLKRGKAYARGVIGSPDGFLPSFVKCDPPVPYREQTTDGGFTRGFLQFDGVSAQAALDDLTDFVRLYPGDADDDGARENMVERGLYAEEAEIPAFEGQRHYDRIRARGAEGDTHFGAVDAVRQSDLLMRAGKTHYPDPDDYIQEAVEHGISKAIPLGQNQEPPVIQPGGTRLWILHPDTDDGWAVIGYGYLQEIVFTEPADGHVPNYVQEYADAGRLDVVDIEPAPDEDDGPNVGLDDFADGNVPEEAADLDADPGGETAEKVVAHEGDADLDVQALPDALRDAFSFQELRQIASAVDAVDAPRRPSTDDLIDLLTDADVTPSDARALLDGDDDE